MWTSNCNIFDADKVSLQSTDIIDVLKVAVITAVSALHCTVLAMYFSLLVQALDSNAFPHVVIHNC